MHLTEYPNPIAGSCPSSSPIHQPHTSYPSPTTAATTTNGLKCRQKTGHVHLGNESALLLGAASRFRPCSSGGPVSQTNVPLLVVVCFQFKHSVLLTLSFCSGYSNEPSKATHRAFIYSCFICKRLWFTLWLTLMWLTLRENLTL